MCSMHKVMCYLTYFILFKSSYKDFIFQICNNFDPMLHQTTSLGGWEQFKQPDVPDKLLECFS
jgi:hypothetical protein